MMREQIEKTKNPALKTIGEYLLKRAETDPSVSNSIKKENKSLDECFNYIKSEAKKKIEDNCAMLSDDEVFGLAVHYYDEDDIKIEKVEARFSTTFKPSKKPKTPFEVKPVMLEIKPEIKKPKKQKKEVVEGQLNLFEVF